MSHPMESAYSLAPGEVLMTCPYDEGHKILRSRLKCHLERCRRNYLKAHMEKKMVVPMAVCQYSEVHQYPAIEIRCHERFCPQKIQKEIEEGANNVTEFDMRPYINPDVDWNTSDVSKKEVSIMDHVKKIYVPPVEVKYDAEEKAFWGAPNTSAFGRPTEYPPFGTGDERVKFVNQRLGKAEKKVQSRFDIENYRRKLETRKIQGKLHFEPKFIMDGKKMIDPEFKLFPEAAEVSDGGSGSGGGDGGDGSDGGDGGDGYDSDMETVYEDARSTISGLDDLERDLEKLKIPGPARFGSMMSLATTCSDFDDFKSCISFDDDD